VGDHDFQRKCLTKIEELKKEEVTIVVVSHSGDLIKEHTKTAIWLKNGEMVVLGDSKKVVPQYFS